MSEGDDQPVAAPPKTKRKSLEIVVVSHPDTPDGPGRPAQLRAWRRMIASDDYATVDERGESEA